MLVFLMSIENEETRSKLEKLYLQYNKDMYITAYSILKEPFDAEDVVHEAILNVSNHLGKIKDLKSKKTRAYLLVIVRNISYKKYNSRKKMVLKENVMEFNEVGDESSYLEESLLKAEEIQRVANILSEVNSAYADILMLRYYYEFEITEIANILDISENNVSVRIHRALFRMKECIEKEEGK